MNRPTDEQLTEWLYDAQYDYNQDPAEYDYDFDKHPMSGGTFPKYYADDYDPTLAALFSEILESRKRVAAVLELHRPAKAHSRCQQTDCPCGGYDCCAHCDKYSARGVRWPCDTYKAITGEEPTR